MAITLRTPGTDELGTVLTALASWQEDGAPFQVHPGDVGWFWRFGAEATAAALRTWSDGDRVLAVGLLDGADLLRVAIAPDLLHDRRLAERVVADVDEPGTAVLPSGPVALELAADAVAHELLDEVGWERADPWAVLRHDLSVVPEPALRVEQVDAELAPAWARVHCAAFGGSPEDEDAVLERWTTMAGGPAFAQARCLLGYDTDDIPVSAVTVWSAGPGRYGIIEPMGTHPDHRGRGHGRSMNHAAAASLKDLACSAAFVCTPASNVGGVAGYVSAGYQELYQRWDRHRPT